MVSWTTAGWRSTSTPWTTGGGGRGLAGVRPCGHSSGENLTVGWAKDGYDDGEPYQGWQLAARQRNEASVGGEWNTTSMLGVGRLGARISRARWGKMLWVKWPWLQAPFIALGRWGEGLEEATDRQWWKFNTGHFRDWRRERSRQGAKLMRGEGRRLGSSLICLLAWGEGWPTVAHSAAAQVRGARWRRGSTRGRRRPRERGQTGRLGNWDGEGFLVKIKDLNSWASDLNFELISRILSWKSKVSNISNWIFELRSN
jgi:hypothetical protein